MPSLKNFDPFWLQKRRKIKKKQAYPNLKQSKETQTYTFLFSNYMIYEDIRKITPLQKEVQRDVNQERTEGKDK
jgi:hypothetical protein